MTDTAEAPEETSTENLPDDAQGVADSIEPEKLDFVLDKYRADGRSEEDAIKEQAKAYPELQSRLGSFVGAPDEYEIALSDELAEHVNLEDYSEDPLFEQAKEAAKEMGMNNEGFNKFADILFKSKMVDEAAIEEVRKEEMKALGNNGERRLQNIESWAKQNLDSDKSSVLLSSLTSAGAVEALESVIAKTRNAPQVHGEQTAAVIDGDKLREMLTAKDDFGNSKMNDPEYRSKVRKLYGQKYGEEPFTRTVG